MNPHPSLPNSSISSKRIVVFAPDARRGSTVSKAVARNDKLPEFLFGIALRVRSFFPRDGATAPLSDV